jgi:hypothetical protein
VQVGRMKDILGKKEEMLQIVKDAKAESDAARQRYTIYII